MPPSWSAATISGASPARAAQRLQTGDLGLQRRRGSSLDVVVGDIDPADQSFAASGATSANDV